MTDVCHHMGASFWVEGPKEMTSDIIFVHEFLP
jgi:hypothetical protein